MNQDQRIYSAFGHYRMAKTVLPNAVDSRKHASIVQQQGRGSACSWFERSAGECGDRRTGSAAIFDDTAIPWRKEIANSVKHPRGRAT